MTGKHKNQDIGPGIVSSLLREARDGLAAMEGVLVRVIKSDEADARHGRDSS